MIHYGFKRLMLFNSAGYHRVELPLDDSVSLVGDNNTGKTSLINALQFMLIIDRRRMNFGAHDFNKAREFYFENNSSYILLEVLLPQTGTVVLGCVGKGVSHDYEYFAYKGELNSEDFRQENGALVSQVNLLEHLASRGKNAFRYDSSAFASLIYGGQTSSRKSGEPDFTVFKLENRRYAKVFQSVLTQTLRLDKLKSSDVKEYLLDIFEFDLSDARINFKEEWDKAFSEVNAEFDQYKAAEKYKEQIEQIEEDYMQRQQLRGKIIVWRERVDIYLKDWQQYYQDQQYLLKEKIQGVDSEIKNFFEEYQQLQTQKTSITEELRSLKQMAGEQKELEREFALFKDRSELESQLKSYQADLEELIATLSLANSRSPEQIKQNVLREQNRLKNLRNQLSSLTDNLYLQLSKQLSNEELQRLNKVLNKQTMMLPPTSFSLDYSRLLQNLQATDSNELQLPGLLIKLSTLDAGYQQKTAAELTSDIADAECEVARNEELLNVATQIENARIKKDQLQAKVDSIRAQIDRFDRLLGLKEDQPARDKKLAEIEPLLKETEQNINNSQQRHSQLSQQKNSFEEKKGNLETSNNNISSLKNQRLDQGPEFEYLEEQSHLSWFGDTEWNLVDLAERLQAYQESCRELLSLNKSIDACLDRVHAGGLTRYQSEANQESEIKRIIDYKNQLPKEREALERKARSAVINVASSLRTLRNNYDYFQNKMQEFNRLIGRRQLSDLKTFKISAVAETSLVEAIDVLIKRSDQVSTGESFELFNQDSVLDDQSMEQARQLLIDEANARDGLRISDLFRLQFIVGRHDHKNESFEDIDAAASNGTVLMAKLVTGLAMLHLMQDKRHNVNTVCYLDEALALDSRNQTNLIETAREFGFALIFASPQPLVTVRYCVAIHTENGKKYISWDAIQTFEPKPESPHGKAI